MRLEGVSLILYLSDDGAFLATTSNEKGFFYYFNLLVSIDWWHVDVPLTPISAFMFHFRFEEGPPALCWTLTISDRDAIQPSAGAVDRMGKQPLPEMGAQFFLEDLLIVFPLTESQAYFLLTVQSNPVRSYYQMIKKPDFFWF